MRSKTYVQTHLCDLGVILRARYGVRSFWGGLQNLTLFICYLGHTLVTRAWPEAQLAYRRSHTDTIFPYVCAITTGAAVNHNTAVPVRVQQDRKGLPGHDVLWAWRTTCTTVRYWRVSKIVGAAGVLLRYPTKTGSPTEEETQARLQHDSQQPPCLHLSHAAVEGGVLIVSYVTQKPVVFEKNSVLNPLPYSIPWARRTTIANVKTQNGIAAKSNWVDPQLQWLIG